MICRVEEGKGPQGYRTKDKRFKNHEASLSHSLLSTCCIFKRTSFEGQKSVQKYSCLPKVSSCEIILDVPREKIVHSILVSRMVGNNHVVRVCFSGKQLPLRGGLPHPLG